MRASAPSGWKVVLVASVVLAAGASPVALAGSCARQNVPAASLLVPYFLVSRNGSQGEDIPEGGADTLLSVTNLGMTGLIVQTTVWNKYGKPVLSFHVPMTANDVVFFRMKDVLGGRLNVNPSTQRADSGVDPCGANPVSGNYEPRTGFGATRYVRFPNPYYDDGARSVGTYADPAFDGAFRRWLWDSLDESADVRDLTTPGDEVLDVDNPACGLPGDGVLAGDLSGFVTFDVVNYCSSFLADDRRRYLYDSLATSGWDAAGYPVNVLMGDIFFVDPRPDGHVSGDPMVSLPFEPSLVWGERLTFYSLFEGAESGEAAGTVAPEPFRFRGDGRAPLGNRFGFRYLSDRGRGLRSWAIVFHWGLTRSPTYPDIPGADLCLWMIACGASPTCLGYGFTHNAFQPAWSTFDHDENRFFGGTVSLPIPWFFLVTQRVDLLDNRGLNPGLFAGGWLDLNLSQYGDAEAHQAWVSVQHSGPGLAMSVGHAATPLGSSLACAPAPR